MKSFTTVLARLPIFVLSMTSVKRFLRAAVSFILLAAALLLLPASAFAEFRPDSSYAAVPNAASGLDMAAGAVLDGALSGLSVDLAFSFGALLTSYDLIQSIISGTPVGTVPDYTYNQPLSEILNQETIKIRKDSITIDGVEYSDVWLPHDAANKFRVNAFDFITHFNIISESNGNYASGVGFIGDFAVYDNGSALVTQVVSVPLSVGSFSIPGGSISVLDTASYPHITFSWIDGSSGSDYPFHTSFPILFQGSVNRISLGVSILSRDQNQDKFYTRKGLSSSFYSPDPFDFTWVSGSIPAEPLPSDQGLRFRVPSAYVSSFPSVVSPDLADYVTIISDLSNALEQARLADAVESVAFEEYDAPAPPVPSTGTIAEEPYSSLDGSLTGIQDSLDNIDTNIGTVDESLDDIQVYAEDAADSLQSIDTNLSQSVADTAGIKGFIQQYLPGVHSLLSSISSSVSDIAGSIAAADQTFFGNVVDSILAPFTPVFDIFKAGVGIWRYVVAWVGNISAPFAWIWSTLSQANSILVSPILASAAAAVVLAVYKRFGR